MKKFTLLLCCFVVSVLSTKALTGLGYDSDGNVIVDSDGSNITWYFIDSTTTTEDEEETSAAAEEDEDSETTTTYTATLTNSTCGETFNIMRTHLSNYPFTYTTGELVIPTTVVDSDTGTKYTITRIGVMAFCTGSNTYNFTSVVIPETVTSIGEAAFYYACQSMTSITIPSSVTSIGYLAFGGAGLTSITIPSSVTDLGYMMFYACTSLATATFGEDFQLDTLPAYIFNHCTSLTTIEGLPDITSVGDYCFSSCTSLESIELPSTVESLGEYAFSNCTSLTTFALPSSLSSIGTNAFYGCSNLATFTLGEGNTSYSLSDDGTMLFTYDGTELVLVAPGAKITALIIPKELKEISESAFSTMTTITSVTFEEGTVCTSIGAYAFQDCTALESMSIPSSITYVGQYAFDGCTALASVKFGDESKLDTINKYTFCECTALTSIELPSTIESIGSYAFYKCTVLESISLPSSIKNIGSYAFYKCTALGSISLPSSIESIGSYAFCGCTSLATLTFAEGIELATIPQHMIDGCVALESIVVPASVTTISDYGLYTGSGSSYSLKSVTFESDSKLEVIGHCALAYYYYVTSLTLPSTLKYISPIAFINSSATTSTEGVGIAKIEFEEGTDVNFKTDDDGKVIFTADGTKLVAVAPAGDFSDYTVPSSVTTLGDSCFNWNRTLVKLTIPESVTTLGVRMLQYCNTVTDVTFEGTTTISSIPDYCFYACTAMTNMDIPETVTSIGADAFYQCYNHPGFVIPTGVTTIGNYAFDGGSSSYNVSVSFAEGNEVLESIGQYAFRYSTLQEVYLPKTLTTLSTFAFYYATSLETVEFHPDCAITEIPNYCFSRCSSLTTLILPKNITTIGNYCFQRATALTTLVCLADDVPTMSGSGTFSNWSTYTGVSLYVPAYSLSSYAAAGNYWSKFGDSQYYPVYSMTIGSAKMATLVLPFDATIPDGVKCYTLETEVSDEEGDGVVYISGTQVEASDDEESAMLAAGTPVVVEGSAGTYYFYGTEDSTVDGVVAEQTTSVPQDGNGLVGTYEDTTIYKTTTSSTSEDDDDSSTTTYYNYVLQNQSGNVRFYQVGESGKSVGQFRAWLQLSDNLLSSTTSSIAFNLGGTTTGIAEVEPATTTATTGIYYDLQGRAVKAPQKGGIYIKDGKKVVI